MYTVDTLLDTVKDRRGIKSDYALAKLLEITYHSLMNYRHGRSRPDDKTLTKLAELGEIDLADVDVLAVQLQVDRSQSEESREMWRRIARRLQTGSAHAGFLAALGVSLLVGVAPRADASPLPSERVASKAGLCVMSNQIHGLEPACHAIAA